MYNSMQSTLLYNAHIEAKIMETNQDVVQALQTKQAFSTTLEEISLAESNAPVTLEAFETQRLHV